MSYVKVKFCGITRLEDAICAVKAGASYLGFIFFAKSPRCVTPEQASEIIGKLPPGIHKVGVFVNESPETVQDIIEQCHLDLVQLHGDETAEYAVKIGIKRVWKAFSLTDINQIAEICGFPCQSVLVDSSNSNQRGGTGKTCDWSLARQAASQRPLVLAGGLSPDNLLEAVTMVNPAVVDVNSGVETAPGIKDQVKILQIMQIINDYNKGNM